LSDWIKIILLGPVRTYLIRAGEGFILVDAGKRSKEARFARALAGLKVSPERIRLIVITHVHYDHVGSLAGIKRRCGCPAAVHESEKEFLEAGAHPVPPGTNALGRAVSFLGRKLGSGLMSFEPVRAEVALGDEYPLQDLGLAGRIIATPGHTRGSVSVLLDSGQAVVGDAAFNVLPFGLGPIMPPFGADPGLILGSWQKLLEAGAREIYPAHGRPFSAGRLERALEHYSRGTI